MREARTHSYGGSYQECGGITRAVDSYISSQRSWSTINDGQAQGRIRRRPCRIRGRLYWHQPPSEAKKEGHYKIEAILSCKLEIQSATSALRSIWGWLSYRRWAFFGEGVAEPFWGNVCSANVLEETQRNHKEKIEDVADPPWGSREKKPRISASDNWLRAENI